jgi:hypothetical protein
MSENRSQSDVPESPNTSKILNFAKEIGLSLDQTQEYVSKTIHKIRQTGNKGTDPNRDSEAAGQTSIDRSLEHGHSHSDLTVIDPNRRSQFTAPSVSERKHVSHSRTSSHTRHGTENEKPNKSDGEKSSKTYAEAISFKKSNVPKDSASSGIFN